MLHKTLRKEDILAAITEHADSLALVMMGGVNYYSGQFFPLAEITEAAHAVGAFCGFDLAHTCGKWIWTCLVMRGTYCR